MHVQPQDLIADVFFKVPIYRPQRAQRLSQPILGPVARFREIAKVRPLCLLDLEAGLQVRLRK